MIMRRGIIAAALIVAAASAHGFGAAVGVFGGTAAPVAAMANEGITLAPYNEVGHLGASWKVGGKGLIALASRLELEAAVAYHANHASEYGGFPGGAKAEETTLIPITAGLNFNLIGGPSPAYISAGTGYYLQKMGYAAAMERGYETYPSPELEIAAPGFYLGTGFGLGLGAFALTFEPRVNLVLNAGEHTTTYEIGPYTYEAREAKDYNDIYVDFLFGLNYRII